VFNHADCLLVEVEEKLALQFTDGLVRPFRHILKHYGTLETFIGFLVERFDDNVLICYWRDLLSSVSTEAASATPNGR